MKQVILSVVFIVMTQMSFAQTHIVPAKTIDYTDVNGAADALTVSLPGDDGFSRVNIGLGLGIDYGGIVGVRLTALPAKPVFVFAALGYNLQTAGFNVGGGVRLAPDKQLCPYLLSMYGYNGVIVIKNAKEYSKTYYVPSAGAGMEIKSRNNINNYLNVELLIPFRPSSYQNDMDDLENAGIQFINKALPVTFSIGYHFGF